LNDRIENRELEMNRYDETTRARLARRAFCKFIATSPLWLGGAIAARSLLAAQIGSDELGAFSVPDAPLIESADAAVNVFDLEAVARNTLPPAHYGQIATGAGSGRTVVRNREAFNVYGIQARRMVGVAKIDTRIELLGQKLAYPLMLSPIGSHRLANPEGELATARGAAAANANMLLSTFSSTGIEDVIQARGAPVWYQLYPSSEWRVSEALVKRAEKAGAPVIVATVDGIGGGRREVFERYRRIDKRDCTGCHTPDDDRFGTAPMFAGLDMKGVGLLGVNIDWAFVRRLRQTTTRKLVIKGILAADDARLAADAGADGIIVSNHGGRTFDTGVGTLDVLPEIVAAVAGRIPVLIDSGFRRGTDVFKALALGASAVCVGRPYMWGLAAFGSEGVKTAFNLIRAEFEGAMRQAGALTLAQIDRTRIRKI
jgi:(S)-2-hydroxy-acid oxidase